MDQRAADGFQLSCDQSGTKFSHADSENVEQREYPRSSSAVDAGEGEDSMEVEEREREKEQLV